MVNVYIRSTESGKDAVITFCDHISYVFIKIINLVNLVPENIWPNINTQTCASFSLSTNIES